MQSIPESLHDCSYIHLFISFVLHRESFLCTFLSSDDVSVKNKFCHSLMFEDCSIAMQFPQSSNIRFSKCTLQYTPLVSFFQSRDTEVHCHRCCAKPELQSFLRNKSPVGYGSLQFQEPADLPPVQTL